MVKKYCYEYQGVRPSARTSVVLMPVRYLILFHVNVKVREVLRHASTYVDESRPRYELSIGVALFCEGGGWGSTKTLKLPKITEDSSDCEDCWTELIVMT